MVTYDENVVAILDHVVPCYGIVFQMVLHSNVYSNLQIQ